MEPERDMEQTLAAYARQRRAEGGEPPALSPANRAELQRAVAGMGGAPAPFVRRAAPLPWWVRWGLPFGLVAAIGAFALVVLPHWAWWTDDRMMTEAASAAGPSLAAAGARGGQAAPPPSAPTVSLPPAGMTLAGRAAVATAPAPADGFGGRGMAAAGPPVAAAPPAPVAAANTAGGMADRSISKRGAAPTVSLASEGFLAPGLPKDLAVQAFTGTPLVMGSPAEGILKAFRIEMHGDEVRLIDADGSVYSGSIGRSDTPLPGRAAGGAAGPPGTSSSAARPGGPLYLRVEGGNRTRQQIVRFSGALVPSAPAGAGFLAGFKLEGRLRVGEAPDVGFEAAPAR